MPCIELPAEVVGAIDTGRVAATVAAGMTGGSRADITETIGEATEIGSTEEEGETSRGANDEQLAAREA